MSNVQRVDTLVPTIAVTNERDAIILYDALMLFAHGQNAEFTTLQRHRADQLARLVAEELVNLRRSEREPSVATLVNERDKQSYHNVCGRYRQHLQSSIKGTDDCANCGYARKLHTL